MLCLCVAQAITNGDPLQAYATITPYGIGEYLSKCVFNFGIVLTVHYKNTPIQIYWKFNNQKGEFSYKKFWCFFHISAQNIYCGYSLEPPRLEPPRQGDSV